MISFCDSVSQQTIDYFWNMAKSYISDEQLGVLYSYREREYGMILDKIIPKPLDTVLDIGCGESMLVLMLARYAKKVYGIDDGSFDNYMDWLNDIKSKEDVKNGKIEIFTQSAKSIPLPDESIDIIYTASAFEHFINNEDVIAANEINRVLKKGGYFVGTVDFNSSTEHPFGSEHFCRVYTLESFTTRIVNPSGLNLLDGIDAKINEKYDYKAKALFFCMYKE